MTGEFAGRRVALFEPNGSLTTNPTLYGLVHGLVESGARVDLWTPGGSDDPYPTEPVRTFPFIWPRAIASGGLRGSLRAFLDEGLRRRTRRRFSSERYDLAIGVDSAGLIAAFPHARKREVPLAYISFEIFFSAELSETRDVREKALEREANAYASLTVVQDDLRAGLLGAENGVDADEMFRVPVAPSGPVVTERSSYLRDRLGIPPDKVIVLHSGSFAPWTYSEELLAIVSSWPSTHALVVHGHLGGEGRNLPNDTGSRVYYSQGPLPPDEYMEMVSSADIGLALYKPVGPSRFTQKNVANIGLASGKFGAYMKCGLPTISVAQPTYADLLGRYNFGANVPLMDALPDALTAVAQNAGTHREQAHRLFAELLDFDLHWPGLRTRLAALMRGLEPSRSR
jgi:hypothetical protein